MTWYAQFEEDRYVAEQFGDHVGLLLDIGAWGVRDFSNSRYFIERGWSAVLCEFSPKPVRELVQEYGYSERVQVIQAAITCEPEHVIEFEVTDDALSTNDPKEVARWRHMSSRGNQAANAGGYYGKLWVPSLCVHALLDQFFGETKKPDYVSIDTEGTSVDLAVNIMRTDHRPRVMVVEHNDRLAYLQQEAQEYQYKAIHTNSTNVILAR